MKFFTSDSHFSLVDNSIIPRDFRPFKNLEEMNKKIIHIWNEQATKDDIIYHLGDFVNYNSFDNINFVDYFKLVNQIKAKVILILGNNENKILVREFGGDFDKFKKFLLDLGFYDVIEKSAYVDINNKKYCLTHRPTDCDMKSKLNLFGHIHKCGFVKKFGFNVGVDNHYFKLFSEEDINDLEYRRKFFDDDVYI